MDNKKTMSVIYETPGIRVLEMKTEGILCASPDHAEPQQLQKLDEGGSIWG